MEPDKSIDFGLLHSLHHLLQLQSDVQEQRDRCPRVIKLAENKVAQLTQAVEQAKIQWQACKKEADAKQMTMNQREARIKQLRERLNTCDSNKEFQLLKDQIAADEQATSVLADEILEMLERADQLNVGTGAARQALADGEAELKRTRQTTSERQDQLDSELRRLAERLMLAETKLPPAFLPDYKRRIASLGPNALAEVQGKSCGGCHQMLNTQTLVQLYQSKLVFCQGCQCVLYLSREALAARDLR